MLRVERPVSREPNLATLRRDASRWWLTLARNGVYNSPLFFAVKAEQKVAFNEIKDLDHPSALALLILGADNLKSGEEKQKAASWCALLAIRYRALLEKTIKINDLSRTEFARLERIDPASLVDVLERSRQILLEPNVRFFGKAMTEASILEVIRFPQKE